jgi:hypothetical protein
MNISGRSDASADNPCVHTRGGVFWVGAACSSGWSIRIVHVCSSLVVFVCAPVDGPVIWRTVNADVNETYVRFICSWCSWGLEQGFFGDVS